MGNVLSCFFPTTVVLVDDDPSFLNFLKVSLAGAPFACRSFLDASEALEFINESSEKNRLCYSNLVRSGEEGTSEWKSVLLNISDLHTEIYSSTRFCKISAVVSDYLMPSMNGVEFCSKILDKSIQRILLTGLAEDRIAIDAFNAGYISRFSRKSLSFDILDFVNRSARTYFGTYTDYVLQRASFGELLHLKDPVFSAFFSKIYDQGNFIEYYMLDAFGSYLLMDADGQRKMLSVLTEAETAHLIDIAIESGEASFETLEKMQSRKYMLVYHNRNGSLPSVSEWDKFLRPAGVIEGRQTYYYSMSDDDRADLDENEIVSFNTFRRAKFK